MVQVKLTFMVLKDKTDKLFHSDPKENSLSMDSVHLISCKEELVIVGFFRHCRPLQKENLLQQELSNQLSTGQMLPKMEACIDFNFTIWANGMTSLLTIRFPWNTLPGQGSTDNVLNPNGCRMSVESMIDQKTLNFGFLS